MVESLFEYNKPNFFIVGTAKSGTTSLYNYLSQHHEVYLPSEVKESNYFVYCNRAYDAKGPGQKEAIFQYLYGSSINEFAEYKKLFSGVRGQAAIGEVCPRYFYYENASINIKKFNPDAKIIVILRNPVDRAFSHYKMLASNSLAPYEFYRELQEEEKRISMGWGWDWHYCELGRYYVQLERYVKLFGKENIKVVLFDDFVKNSLSVMRSICSFLTISEEIEFDLSKRHMVSYNARSRTAHNLMNSNAFCIPRNLIKKSLPADLVNRIKVHIKQRNKSKKNVDAKSKLFILEKLLSDIEKLESLLGVSLESWKY